MYIGKWTRIALEIAVDCFKIYSFNIDEYMQDQSLDSRFQC